MSTIETVEMPGINFPSWRVNRAAEAGVIKNILFVCWGGMGDQICCEPTIREMFRRYPMCTISIATDFPDLFNNLGVKVYDLQKERPKWEDYFCLYGMCNPSSLVWQFIQHGEINGVDFSSLMALRGILPKEDKHLEFKNQQLTNDERSALNKKLSYEGREQYWCNLIAVHPGRTWPTRTYPADWYNEILRLIKSAGKIPVLIGGDMHGKGTVDVNPEGCIDVRGQLSIKETFSLLDVVPLVTNDSAPMHMAASGNKKIAFLATARKGEYVGHWRTNPFGVNEFMYNMKDFAKGGIWEHLDHTPGSQKVQALDKIDEETLRTWLPEPKEIVDWIVS